MRLRKVISPYIPYRVKRLLSSIAYKLRYVGWQKYCPACQSYSRQFRDFDLSPYHVKDGIIPNKVITNTLCPWCGSHIHHRLMWFILPSILAKLEKTNNYSRRILHFAPERFSIPRLSSLRSVRYIQTDYMRNDVDVVLDMCQLGLVSCSIDLIIASHVLEHVPNDDMAIQELYRILKPGGVAVLLVPLLADQSIELPNICTEFDRIKYYGQHDHLRAYGLDLQHKISNHGFEVRIVYAEEYKEFGTDNYLLPIQGRLFLATKPLNGAYTHA